MELVQPHEGVVEDVVPDRAGVCAVEVDQVTPGVAPGLEVRPESGQVVPGRAEVVVDDVEHDGQAPAMAGVDEPFQAVRTAVALVDRVPEHPVIAPVPFAVEVVDRQQFDVGDAEFGEIVQSFDRGVERALLGERSDVQFVDDRARAARGRATPCRSRRSRRRRSGSGRERRRAGGATGDRGATARRRRAGNRSHVRAAPRAHRPATTRPVRATGRRRPVSQGTWHGQRRSRPCARLRGRRRARGRAWVPRP